MVIAAALACGGDEGTTEGTEGAGSSSGGTTGSSSTSATTGGSTTGEPTGGETTSTTEPATTGPACETSAESCGVMVSDQGSSCPEPQPSMGELQIEVLGPGQIKVTEVGYDSTCGMTITPVVKIFAPNTISITYDVGGQGMDGCICKFSITSTLSGLPSGTWTVNVLPYSQQVEVP